ncbi:MAG: glutathionylspermidine synthase family protein [Pseudomonadota bacterium]
MRRVPIASRPEARQRLEAAGCHFAEMYGEPYMWETLPAPHAYELTGDDVDAIDAATRSLHDVALEVADRAATDEASLARLSIPAHYRDAVVQSWGRGDAALYQRMDLALDERDGQWKLLEYNADTPTGAVEMNCYLEWWLDGVEQGLLPRDCEHYNDFRLRLTEYLERLDVPGVFYFAAARGLVEEENTVEFLRRCADDGGIDTQFIYLDEIGTDDAHNLADRDQLVIENLFKLFPWEDIAEGPFANAMARNTSCQLFEPTWKMMWSNKAFLVLAWEMFPGHPHLLPAYFDDELSTSRSHDVIKKPQWGREGQNTAIVRAGAVETALGGEYADNRMIVQELIELLAFDQRYPVFGSWVIDHNPVGLLIREDANRITSNLSTCLPHYYLP